MDFVQKNRFERIKQAAVLLSVYFIRDFETKPKSKRVPVFAPHSESHRSVILSVRFSLNQCSACGEPLASV